MSHKGPHKQQDNDQKDYEQKAEADIWAYEYDFGADVFKEAFGVNEPSSGLFWLANRLCDTTAAVIESIRTCGRRFKAE